MTSRDFAYWLQGFFEILDANKNIKPLSETRELTIDQVECIKKHLNMVFMHEIDPSFPDRAILQSIHDRTGKPQEKVLTLPQIKRLVEEEGDKVKEELKKLIDRHESKPHGGGGGGHDTRLMC